MDPSAIDEPAVAAYVARLRSLVDDDGRPSLSPASIARGLVAVRSFHRFCVAEDLLPTDPSAEIGSPRVPQGIPKALEEDEVAALLDAIADDGPTGQRDRAILEMLYATGVRISELVGLDLGDLDLDDGLARVMGKGGRERIVPVGRVARGALHSYLAVGRVAHLKPRSLAGTGADAVFLNSRGGRLSRQSCWKIVQGGGGARRTRGSSLPPRVASLLRNPHARSRGGHTGRPGAPGPCERLDHTGVHEGVDLEAEGRIRLGSPPGAPQPRPLRRHRRHASGMGPLAGDVRGSPDPRAGRLRRWPS